ncbi:MAG: hypothetical protein LBN71_10860 [Tannerella sp.]|jgi:hypothetical protein|nr:hypothetical protein [Tannerella sp.]
MKSTFIKYFKAGLCLWLIGMFTSCLTSGLEELPAFDTADITDIRFDFRYKDASSTWIDNEPVVKVVSLTIQNKVIDTASGTVTCTLAVPAANGTFTEAIRQQVSLTSVVGRFYLSTAAVIVPVEGAPVLGVPGDFSATRKYKVTAADGTTKVWTISVTNLSK